jgi:hypothetical protein
MRECPIVELDASDDEEAAARHEVELRPRQPIVDESAQARFAARLLEGRRDHVREEALRGLVEDGDLDREHYQGGVLSELDGFAGRLKNVLDEARRDGLNPNHRTTRMGG